MPKKSERFEASAKRLHRILAILRMLDNRARCTPKSLAEKFDISDRTIQRDISDLNYAGFSITLDEEQNTYRFTDPEYTLETSI